MERQLNINVGVLGHVDSGKTALVAALSEVLSTAALDKHPQSKERGITLDLGFSAFKAPCPDSLKGRFGEEVETLQFTLVDCPGHASLIRTVLAGAHILDVMILVVDCCKGVQAQTAECIVIGELLSERMIVALNKVDLLPEEGRLKAMRKAGRNVLQALQMTRFANSEIVPVAAKVGGAEGRSQGIDALREALVRNVPAVSRPTGLPFLFMVDHCFPIKGQGTVMTGTVLQGRVAVGDVVELPTLKQTRKVKSIQCFKRPVKDVRAGDRAGICVTQLPTDSIERSLLSAPSLLHSFEACVCTVERCRFFAGEVSSRKKLHVTIGHQTVMAQTIFFGLPDEEGVSQQQMMQQIFQFVGKHAVGFADFDLKKAYQWQDELYGPAGRPRQGGPFSNGEDVPHFGREWVLLLLEKPIVALPGSVMLATKLDMTQEASEPDCRIVMYGNITCIFTNLEDYKQLRLYKVKWREGEIDRIDARSNTVIIKNMFKKETFLTPFMGMQVVASSGEKGMLQQPFGKSGKVKASFDKGLPSGTDQRIALCFKRFVYDDKKVMVQEAVR